MATPHKSIFVPEDEKEMFNNSADNIMNELNMNFSELVRQVIGSGELLTREQLSYYMSREARKSEEYKYLVLRTKA